MQLDPPQWTRLPGLSKPRPTNIYKDKQQEEYWSFLESDVSHDVRLPPPTRCPSLVSGDTLSSRNSSTRSSRSTWSSIRSSIWEPVGLRNSVPYPEDANLNARTSHFEGQLVEMCPVKTCERYRKGFTKAGDKNRHVLTHFKRALLCGFCETTTVAFTQSSDPATPFLAHLINHHGVKEPDAATGERRVSKSRTTNPVANCSVCLEPFTAQIMYEHLPGCILREVTRNAEAGASREQGAIYKIEIVGHPSDRVTGSHPPVSPVAQEVTQDIRELVHSTEPECRDMSSQRRPVVSLSPRQRSTIHPKKRRIGQRELHLVRALLVSHNFRVG
jgi:hypothetical protein